MILKKNYLPVIIFFLFILTAFFPVNTEAFQYINNFFPNSQFNAENLLQNCWFNDSKCNGSLNGWQTLPVPLDWGAGSKFQDPADINCDGTWAGSAARFADKNNADPFAPNQNALLWQVVGPVSPTNKTLYFHALIVAHRVNQYKAEIYGSSSANGPWISVGVPFNIQGPLALL